ncbi:Mfa1 family fimbria major subunit [Phocaeicola plebeius]|uniref:Mfa1 family fimbria major subunit n=1 Tax=Phocaeicola plebeius TaxID=310297 RepID=UPI00307E04C1
MKLSKSLFLAFAGLGLFACSNEDNVPSTDNSHSGTFLTLTLVGTENSGSRTVAGEDGTVEGTVAESTISKAMVVLCASDGTIQSAKEVSCIKKDDSSVETYPVEAGVGTYYVYVIANPGTTLFDGITGNIKSLEKAITSSADFATNSQFLMFSECHGTDKTGGQVITVSAENDYDNPAKTASPIKLDRLAAKITYKQKEGGVDITAAESQLTALEGITFNGFNLVNGIKNFYLQQHWSAAAPVTDIEVPTPAPYVNTLLTPTVVNNAKADFYNRWDDFRTITKEDNGSYTAAIDLKKGTYGAGPLYCMENNSGSTAGDCFATGSDLNGNTTGVIFKATAAVTGSDGIAGTNCFYAYNGEYFATLAAVQGKFPGAFDDKNGGTNAKAELKAAQDELTAAYGKTDATAKEQAISDFRVKYNIHVYEDGVMYYTHYIEDQNYTAANADGQQVKYQSVMRNTVYGLTVNSVKNIGDDIPGGWNPDTDPEDPTTPKTYLVVECKVNPWVLSNYDVDLQ